MKFLSEVGKGGLMIPISAMEMAGLPEKTKVEYYALSGCVIVIPRKMNALELIYAANSMNELSSELCTITAMAAGFCEDACGHKSGVCPFEAQSYADEIDLPEGLRDLAGLEQDAPLSVTADEEEGEIVIRAMPELEGIDLIPGNIMAGFRMAGVCPASLDLLIREEAEIYG